MGIGLRALLATVALLATAALAPAQEGVKVVEIRFEGNRRYSEPNLEYSMKTKEGAVLDRDLLAQDEAMLNNFFETVSIREEAVPEGVRLVFIVTENPLISRVDFLGVESLPIDDIRALADTRAGHPLADHRLKHDRDLIERKYRDAGYHWVEVQVEILSDEGGTRRVVFRVVEGPFVESADVVIRGNRWVPAGDLRSVMALRPSWSFLSSTPFVERRLEEDRVAVLHALRDRGFLEAKVWIEGVTFDEGRDDAFITVVVEEGEAWTVGEVTLVGGEGMAEREGLQRALERIKTGQRWLRRDIERVTRDLEAEAYRLGHAEARVQHQAVPRAEGRVQDLRFTLKEGPRFRIRSIDVAGNVVTRDKVILREFAVYPGEPLDSNAIAKGVRRVRDTGYFGSVFPVTLPADDPNEKDVEIRVTEADRLRAAKFGVGLNSDTGVFGMFSITWRNFDIADVRPLSEVLDGRGFSGAGQTLTLRLEPGSEISNYRLGFMEPWFTDRRLLGGVDLYLSKNRLFEYDEDRAGVELRVEKTWLVPGQDIDDLWSVGLRPRAEAINLSGVDSGAPPNAYAIQGHNDVFALAFDVVWRRLDQEATTERGLRVDFQSELGGGPLGGDFDFLKNTIEARRVWTVFRDEEERAHTLQLRLGAGAAMTLEDGVKVPLVERLFAGGGTGVGAVRGYAFGRLGPHGQGDPSRRPWRVLRSVEQSFGEPMGGDALATGSIEYGAPLFSDVLRGAAWLDAGNVGFNTGDLRTDWRVAAGFGLSIKVPFFGAIPLRFDFGWPLHSVDGDGERILWFAIEKYF